jgi:NADPH-dependent glutamate synthase beta subunit-like oxidoreductase
MPAGSSELMKAVEEGVEFLWRVSPVRLRGKKTVKTVEFVLNQMVPSGKGGRKGFKEIAGTEFSFPVNTVILALGKERDLEVPSRHEGEKLHRTPKPYNLERVNSSRVGTG